MDAVDALTPAYESMGIMFTVASKEVRAERPRALLA